MRLSYSIQDISKLFNHCVSPAGLLVSVTASSISTIMKSSKGKERMLAFWQYSMELYKTTILAHLQTIQSAKRPCSLTNAIKIENSMRNGRKLMRVLMFLDEFTAVEGLIKKKVFSCLKILEILTHLSGAVFFLLDNLVWCSDIGIISKRIHTLNLRWRNTKDLAALTRSVLQCMISVSYAFRSLSQQEVSRHKITLNKQVYRDDALLDDLLGSRRAFRFRVIDVIINILRFFMLWKSLRLPYGKYLSKEFSAICGIISTSFGLFSMLVGESIVRIEPNRKPSLPRSVTNNI